MLITPNIAKAAAKEGVSSQCYIEAHARCNGKRDNAGQYRLVDCHCECHTEGNKGVRFDGKRKADKQ